MNKYTFLLLFLLSCSVGNKSGTELNEKEFRILMNNIAEGWSAQNTNLALSSFHEDAIYMEPPSTQYFRGHEQLRLYFDALTESHNMRFHNLWFDVQSQTGTGEFTFSYGGDTSTVGMVVVELKDGKIQFWREYLTHGPTDFNEFLKIDGKDWEWHIGNYP